MIFPGVAYRPVQSHGGQMTAHLGLCLHVQQGNNSPYGELSNPRNEVSSTLWVAKSGLIEQYVDSDLVAWAQKSGNYAYNSVETEGWVQESLTNAQLDSLARIYVQGHNVYGWPMSLAEAPGQRGFGWHGMGGDAWGGHPNCPSDIRKGQRSEVLARAARLLAPPAVAIPAPVITDMGEVTMQRLDQHVPKLDDNGNGWIPLRLDASRVVSIVHNGPHPPADGYWPIPRYGRQSRDGGTTVTIEGGPPNGAVDFTVWSM